MAAIVTTVVTVILLGVLIPIFQTTQAKSNQVRSSLDIQAAIYDDATQAEISALKTQLEADPPRRLGHLHQQAAGARHAEERAEGQEHPPAAPHQPAAGQLRDQGRRRLQPGLDPGSDHPDRAERQAAADLADRPEHLRPPAGGSQKIEQVTSALKIVLTVITALLIVASLMLVGNTIRLSIYTRRREVEVMRLVGATRWFIRWPFMIEGVVVGFTGGLVAILILWLGKITIVDPLSNTFSFLAAQNNSTLSFPLLVAHPLRRRGAGLGGRLRRHAAALPQGLRPVSEGVDGSRRPSAALLVVLCAGMWLGGHPGKLPELPPRPLRRLLRRAHRRSDRTDPGQLLPPGRPDRAGQLLPAGDGAGAAPAVPRPLLRLLLAAEPGALQRGDRRPLLRRRDRDQRGQARPARRPRLPRLAGGKGRDRAGRRDRLGRRPARSPARASKWRGQGSSGPKAPR